MASWYSLSVGLILLFVPSCTADDCGVTLCVKTGSKDKDGTDAKVFVMLILENTRFTPWILLEPNKNDFNNGSFQCYDMNTLDYFISNTKIVNLGFKLRGQVTSNSAWYVRNVVYWIGCHCFAYLISKRLDVSDDLPVFMNNFGKPASCSTAVKDT